MSNLEKIYLYLFRINLYKKKKTKKEIIYLNYQLKLRLFFSFK